MKAISLTSLLPHSIHDLPRWFNNMELASSDCDVPEEQYSDVAIYFLTGELKEVMLERKDLYLKESKKVFWDWEDFKEDLRRLVGERFFLFIYFFNRMFNYLFLKIIAVVTIFYRRGSQKYVGLSTLSRWSYRIFKFSFFFLPSVISSSSHQFSNRAGDAMAQLRKSHPFIASSIGLGMIIGGTAVLIPALGLMAMNRRRLNHPVCISSPQH